MYSKQHQARRKPKKKKGGELELFKQIWLDREHVSWLSERPLYEGIYWINQFAHVIAKGVRPDLRLLPENIVLLTPDEHAMYDQGTEKARQEYAEQYGCDWQKLYDLKDALEHI